LGGIVCLIFFDGAVGFFTLMIAAPLWGWLAFRNLEKADAVCQQRAEDALRSIFEPSTKLIGKNIDYIIGKAGEPSFFASMDHGMDVAQWRVGNVVAEVLFQSRACTQLEVRPIRK
jgi:hypothetical protein